MAKTEKKDEYSAVLAERNDLRDQLREAQEVMKRADRRRREDEINRSDDLRRDFLVSQATRYLDTFIKFKTRDASVDMTEIIWPRLDKLIDDAEDAFRDQMLADLIDGKREMKRDYEEHERKMCEYIATGKRLFFVNGALLFIMVALYLINGEPKWPM